MTLTISFPADTEAKLRDTAAATGKDVPTLVREAVEEKLLIDHGSFGDQSADLTHAIHESRSLLTLRDEDDELMVSQPTWERAIEFLTSSTRAAFREVGAPIDAPAILPGPHGSIDLHWKLPHYEMLINIPSDTSLRPSYYGDDREGNSVKGTIASGDNKGLLLWLTTRK